MSSWVTLVKTCSGPHPSEAKNSQRQTSCFCLRCSLRTTTLWNRYDNTCSNHQIPSCDCYPRSSVLSLKRKSLSQTNFLPLKEEMTCDQQTAWLCFRLLLRLSIKCQSTGICLLWITSHKRRDKPHSDKNRPIGSARLAWHQSACWTTPRSKNSWRWLSESQTTSICWQTMGAKDSLFLSGFDSNRVSC